MLTISRVIDQLNEWGRSRVPFLFLIDFEMMKPKAWRLDEVTPDEILFSLNGYSNARENNRVSKDIKMDSFPISFDEYKAKFDFVHERLSYGDSFLVNLTVKSPVTINNERSRRQDTFKVSDATLGNKIPNASEPLVNNSLLDLFFLADAKYKCLLQNEFLCFSPETFVQIKDRKIFSYPMKGTMDASLPNAEKELLGNKKELAEHITIVDLIRNDLSRVATNVTIKRFRYVEEIKSRDKKLLQVSSEITGDLPEDYTEQLGSIIVSLLPAGSISGAPKPKTIEIIQEAEKEKRGYYTGVFGYFDGKNLDSGVAIRYIEQVGKNTFYRSGGGITSQSSAIDEYNEVIQKIYVPIS
jgi:para-aminobenzoate synthetase component 1